MDSNINGEKREALFKDTFSFSIYPDLKKGIPGSNNPHYGYKFTLQHISE